MNIFNMTALQLGEKIKNKEISCIEVINYFFTNVTNKSNGYITLTQDYAINRAKYIQSKIDKSENLSILAGVPISIKDNICTKNIKTTCASKMLKDFIPSYSSTVFKRLENAGAILVGKNNMDEFAMGDTGKTSFYGSCKNPWDNTKSTGGSSSGCASTLSCKEAILTLGSDTGGSIRQPSSFCSITGIKPTYGLISRYGLVSFAPKFDQIGPMTKDALDCAKTLEIISGYDKYDNTTIKKSNFTFINKNFNVKGLKIGVCKNFIEYSNKDVQKEIINAINIFKNMGAIIEEINLDILDYSIPTYKILSNVQCTSNMARYDGIKYGYSPKDVGNLEKLCIQSRTDAFGVEVKTRIMFGNFILKNKNTHYNNAINAKNYITKQFKDAFNKHDILLTPTTPTTAISFNGDNDSDIFLVSSNICGIPAISIPCGFTKNNMPVGMQLIGNYLKDDVILNTAIQFQKCTNFHLKTHNII
ncbi:Asp-tRNA(Asn)/Glu-tRNA(Gln) amidotransferase subunit GatA [uncultured Tyzzerella sp.]|uniref:Asp-tRNA(Asn)/Glu-tRNA(Gln) amidotransferase subunit GatA n=1 Tax=uncultured Tyzzerella sp. TaxID=2321398 RepID=UPI0029437FF7|nr:Asp-tRNA(Asn)/Glu-tRNA(Gln) amidotransferase subunit GatA [uncultured Tyzzerella sp.]